MLSWFRRNLIEGQYADITTAKAAAEYEKKKKEEEEKKKREEEERRRQEEERRRQEEEKRREEMRRQQEEKRQEEERRQQTDDSRRVEESRQAQQSADERRRNQQPQTLEEESALVRQRLEEQRRRQEEQKRLEEERRRQEEERRRREEEERRRREEEERRRREEEQRRREEGRRRQEEQRRQQLLTVEEESEIIRRTLEEQRRRRAQQSQPGQHAPGAPEGGGEGRSRGEGGGRKQHNFDDVAKMLQEAKDPRKVVEKLREMGYEVEEVSDRGMFGTTLYGWVVKAGDRYIAISSGARVGRGDVGDYAVMELSDRGVAKNFLVGRYYGSAWGSPDFVARADAAAQYERELDRWMKEELGKAGYRAERMDWGPNAATPGFTYVIKDKEGRKVGEVQVAKIGFRYSLVDTGLPPGVLASNDPRRAAAYFVYRHETKDEDIAWRLAVGDERAKELYMEKTRYESELKAREEWFRELTQRGLKPIAYSKIDGRPVVSENDLFLDEKTGVTYRVVLERRDGRIAMKLVPASERDERLLALKSLETEGFRVVDDKTVEKDGIRYAVRIEERDGKKLIRLEPEDARKAAERELWWQLWREGFARRGEYAVKDGVRYKIDIEERDGRYVAKLTPVGPASPEEEPRRYRRGDMRSSLVGMRQLQSIEKFSLERPLKPEELSDVARFGVGGRPRPEDLPYFPGVDEAFYGAVGVPLSQTLQPAARELYQRYATATLPGPRVQGLTLPERQQHERVAETQRIYAERFEDVWTPLSFCAPKAEDVNWRTAVATAAEVFTFWVPAVKSAAAFAAARGLKVPGLTAERTVAAGRALRLPRVPGDYFEIHYVEPRALDNTVRGAFVGYGVGEGAAVRGSPGNWEVVFARSAGQPAPGWAFEFATATYRDVAEWLKKLPSIGVRTEVRPRTLRFSEVRGFARDTPTRLETPGETPRSAEIKVADAAEPPARETPRVETPTQEQTSRVEVKTVEERVESARVSTGESPRSELAEMGGSKQVALQQRVAKAEEELVRPIKTQLPLGQPARAQMAVLKVVEEGQGAEPQRASGQAPPAFEVPVAGRQVDEYVREAELPVASLRELRLVPETWSRGFTAPLIYPFEIRTFETPTVSTATYEAERTAETAGYTTWTAETPSSSVRTAETRSTQKTRSRHRLLRRIHMSGVGTAAAVSLPTSCAVPPGLRVAAGGCMSC
jgi:hypothetical protein